MSATYWQDNLYLTCYSQDNLKYRQSQWIWLSCHVKYEDYQNDHDQAEDDHCGQDHDKDDFHAKFYHEDYHNGHEYDQAEDNWPSWFMVMIKMMIIVMEMIKDFQFTSLQWWKQPGPRTSRNVELSD